MGTETKRGFIHRRRAELFKEQHGDCYWCKEPMILLDTYPAGPIDPDVCTLDHLFDRKDPRRRKHKNGEARYVAACWQCNHDRGVETTNRVKASRLAKQANLSPDFSAVEAS